MPTPLEQLYSTNPEVPESSNTTPLEQLYGSSTVDVKSPSLPKNDIGKTPLEQLYGNQYGASESAIASGMSNTLGPDSALFGEHRKPYEGGIVADIFDTLQYPFRVANTLIAPMVIPRLRYGDNATKDVFNNPEFNWRDELIRANPEALKTWP